MVVLAEKGGRVGMNLFIFNHHNNYKRKTFCMKNFVCFIVLLACMQVCSFAQVNDISGTYISANNGSNMYILKTDHTFICYWYGETFAQTNKDSSARFSGKGTWEIKEDTIGSGRALFLEFDETKGERGDESGRIEHRFLIDEKAHRIYSLLYLRDEKRYELYESFDKK
jgi:hypothetical protein